MVFQAGFVSFFRTLFIIAAVYIGLRWLFRWLFPILLQRFVRKQQNKFYGGNSSQDQTDEGEVKVKSKRKSNSNDSSLGEYVEYEEIDEKESK